MPLAQTTATIARSSPRYAEWLEIYGTDTLPICSPVPARAYAPDGSVQSFYRVRVDLLTPEQLDRAARHVAQKFERVLEEVLVDLFNPEHGMPILADDVSVAFDARYAL